MNVLSYDAASLLGAVLRMRIARYQGALVTARQAEESVRFHAGVLISGANWGDNVGAEDWDDVPAWIAVAMGQD